MDENAPNPGNNNSPLYITLTAILFMLPLWINIFIKVVYCALILTILAYTINSMVTLQGKSKAFTSMLLCISIDLIVLYNMQYYLYGKLINGLIVTSLLSLLLSSYFGVKVLLRLEFSYSFPVRNLISMCVYAFVDSFIVALLLTSKFPINKVLVFFYKELAYKLFFTFVLYLFLSIILHFKRFFARKYFVQCGVAQPQAHLEQGSKPGQKKEIKPYN